MSTKVHPGPAGPTDATGMPDECSVTVTIPGERRSGIHSLPTRRTSAEYVTTQERTYHEHDVAIDDIGEIHKLNTTWLLGRMVIWIPLFSTTLAVGLLYTLRQTSLTGQAATDSAFVGLLLSSTLLIYQGARLFHAWLCKGSIGALFMDLDDHFSCDSYYRAFGQKLSTHAAWHKLLLRLFPAVHHLNDRKERIAHATLFVDTIFEPTGQVLVGVLYGVLLASAPFMLQSWPNHVELKLELSAFLFCCNFISGFGMCAVIRYVVCSSVVGPHVPIYLFDRSLKAARVFSSAVITLSSLATAYVALSLLSVMFSVFPVRGSVPTIVYGGFALVALLCVLVMPLMPIRKKLEVQKNALLARISRMVQVLTYSIVDSIEDDSFTDETYASVKAKLEGLQAIYAETQAVFTLPAAYRVVQAAIGMAFMTAAPFVVTFAQEKLSGMH